MVEDRNLSALPALVFDVNETLLDVQSLQPHFERLFHDGAVLKQWFAHMLLYSQTLTQVGSYADFGKLAGAALQMTAEIHGVPLTEEDISAVTQSLRSLPPHSDVADALARLKHGGFRIFALTNSAQQVAIEQIESAGLTPLFERVFSVGAVRKYKPAPEPYRHVAHELGMGTSRLTMIAAHPWDLMGAKAAGCRTGFVQRPGTAWFPLVPPPDIRGKNLSELADQLMIPSAR